MQRDEKIQNYIKKIQSAHFGNPDQEKSLCEELLSYAESRGDLYGVGVAYTYFCDYYILIHEMEPCSKWLRLALTHNLDYQFQDLTMLVYNFYGIYSNYIHDDMTAFEYFLKALELAEKLGDSMMQYRLYNNIAASFHNKKDYETALMYYCQAYGILTGERVGEFPLQHRLSLIQNLLNCSITMKDRGRVEEYLKDMEELLGDYPELEKDSSIPYQNAVVLYFYGKEEEAFSILNGILDWEGEDPLDAGNIIELYPIIFNLLIERQEKELSWKILKSLNRYLEKESPQANQEAKALYVRFFDAFGMERELACAYGEYYRASQEALESIAKNRIDAMKEKLHSFEVQQKLVRLQELTYVDELSGLYNRRYYDEYLEKSAGVPSAESLGIVVVDIDFFKEYNDYYGHDRGDQALVKVAGCLRGEAGRKITPCRYGGDEFACVCVDASEEEIESYISRVIRRLAALNLPHCGAGEGKRLTISCGYSLRPMSEAGDTNRLFREADKALYRAKQSGKNCSRRYEETDGREAGAALEGTDPDFRHSLY